MIIKLYRIDCDWCSGDITFRADNKRNAENGAKATGWIKVDKNTHFCNNDCKEAQEKLNRR